MFTRGRGRSLARIRRRRIFSPPERVNAGGHAYLSHTKLGDRYTLRLAIGNIRTDRSHIEMVWKELRDAASVIAGTR